MSDLTIIKSSFHPQRYKPMLTRKRNGMESNMDGCHFLLVLLIQLFPYHYPILIEQIMWNYEKLKPIQFPLDGMTILLISGGNKMETSDNPESLWKWNWNQTYSTIHPWLKQQPIFF